MDTLLASRTAHTASCSGYAGPTISCRMNGHSPLQRPACHAKALRPRERHCVPLGCHAGSSFSGTSLRFVQRQQASRLTGRGGLVVRAGAFDNLANSLGKAWDLVRKDGKLTAENIKTPIREIRRALLEADVSLPVVRSFVKKVEADALGIVVTKGVKPEQQLVKVVYEQLKELMGSKQEDLVEVSGRPQVILMAGLQGVGKTTACGKLALNLKSRGKRVLMVATDIYRPAAIDQLERLGERIEVPVFQLGQGVKPPEIARRGLEQALADGYDAVIVDTAGRTQIDADMMAELAAVKAAVQPSDTLLVVDAMTGQEAAGLVKAFDEAAGITGAILTKLDGDSRGGAALSVRAVSGKPIKFVGLGEKLEALEPFYPDRMAGRILGMGDVLSLVERAETAIKEDEAAQITKKIMLNKFDFNDFLLQMRSMNKMGSMTAVMKMLPGMSAISEKQLSQAEKQLKLFEAMINSMTPKEREQPELLAQSASRRRRVARGSGRKESEVSAMLGMFTGMRARMQDLSKMMAMGGQMGMPGMPKLTEEEMLQSMIATSAPKPVAPGKVRRKRKDVGKKGFGGRGGLAELAQLAKT